jgi:hypothetical protein
MCYEAEWSYNQSDTESSSFGDNLWRLVVFPHSLMLLAFQSSSPRSPSTLPKRCKRLMPSAIKRCHQQGLEHPDPASLDLRPSGYGAAFLGAPASRQADASAMNMHTQNESPY